MTKIGLIADTHGWLDEKVFGHFRTCQEIWHAGDFGNIGIAQELADQCKVPVRGVYGNIDGYDVRSVIPEELAFTCEGVKVFMKHIGGYPGRYAPGVKQKLVSEKARLFISGHSHILKVQFDKDLQCLHMNPGAAGKQGWHKVRTIIRFVIDGTNMKDCEVIELGKR
ncbi:metallophosphoesterase family protein [Flavihumibacter fluvii]|uniref:metallophosphoesterase family protein n=1 Tax=Flavihumibacter fluvii TaxID=2838157 RepID=UPI001BDF3EBA|nr:metallophosphoesterase family protein [Flavihumibacter fluvii]ULQ53635.1 metallophosphatase family protein [Flavihumibacter fluvii]